MLKRLFCLRSSSRPPLFQFDQYSKARYSNKTCRWCIKLAKDCSPPCILRESFKDVTLIFFYITEIFLLYSYYHYYSFLLKWTTYYYFIHTLSIMLLRNFHIFTTLEDFNSEKTISYVPKLNRKHINVLITRG